MQTAEEMQGAEAALLLEKALFQNWIATLLSKLAHAVRREAMMDNIMSFALRPFGNEDLKKSRLKSVVGE